MVYLISLEILYKCNKITKYISDGYSITNRSVSRFLFEYFVDKIRRLYLIKKSIIIYSLDRVIRRSIKVQIIKDCNLKEYGLTSASEWRWVANRKQWVPGAGLTWSDNMYNPDLDTHIHGQEIVRYPTKQLRGRAIVEFKHLGLKLFSMKTIIKWNNYILLFSGNCIYTHVLCIPLCKIHEKAVLWKQL